MKDARGHGSNGSNSALTQTQGPAPTIPRGGKGKGGKGFGGVPLNQIHGGAPVSSNAQAAQSLMSTLKSTQAPIHPAMVGLRASPDGGSAS